MIKEYMEKNTHLNRKEFISVLCLIIVISGIFGWIYEVIFYFMNSGFKQVYMRGSNYLPWINIYAYGALLIILLTYKRRKKPFQVFMISAISTGILEFLSGYILYDKLGWVKCWDYNQEILNFGNIGGFVCLRSVLFFAISGLILIYGILPTVIHIVKKTNINKILIVSIVICSIFLIDEVYGLLLHPYFSIPKGSDFYKSKGIKYIYFSE